MKKVAVIMGSKTDLPIMQGAADVLKHFGIPHDVQIVSAHRTPEFMVEFAQDARKNGYCLIIAGAGGAAHLPGMVASLTTLPVIGVPVTVTKLNGLDALLSIVQMPKGVPVATVAVDNSVNAGLLAVRMVGMTDSKIEKKLETYRKEQSKTVREMNKSLKKKK